MKVLSVRQPWASLICSGAKVIENRKWQPIELPGRILVHASAKKVPKDFRLYISPELRSVVDNLNVYGICPEYEDMPIGAIIGYVDVTRFSDNSNSVWAEPGNIHWHLENAHLFDNPILYVKGEPMLFEYPLDEDNLPPAHKVEHHFPVLEGERMTVHVGKGEWRSLHFGSSQFSLEILDPHTFDIICQKGGHDLKSVKEITFIHDNMEVTLNVTQFLLLPHWDKNGNDIYISSGNGNMTKWLRAAYMLDNNLQQYGL